jgi:mycothiol synthase
MNEMDIITGSPESENRNGPMKDDPDAASAAMLTRPAVAGLVLRAPSPDELAAPGALVASMVAVVAAANAAEGVDETTTVGELVNWITHPGEHFDPASDLVLALVDEALVGYLYVQWVDTTDGLREFRLGGYVDPAWQRRGIGHALLGWGERRAAERVKAAPTDRPVVVGSFADERRAAKISLLQGLGYQPTRWFFEMLRPSLDEIDVPPLPKGLEIRPLTSARHEVRRLFDADVEAFQDHWGGFAADDAAFEEWLTEPNFDPSLYVVAWDGDEIAGAVENTIYASDNATFGRKRGWLDGVFTRRPWRRRGLGAALVARSLVVLRERGMTEAMLGVDSDNPSGALGLYKRAGFVEHQRSVALRKPLAVGVTAGR